MLRADRVLRSVVLVEVFWGVGMIGFETLMPARLAEQLGGVERAAVVLGPAAAGAWGLYAVGAAVIGGTSLFGGKGKVHDAVIGGLVIATIANGLGLLNQASYINFIVTGGVLLLAASVDAVSRRRRSSTGT